MDDDKLSYNVLSSLYIIRIKWWDILVIYLVIYCIFYSFSVGLIIAEKLTQVDFTCQIKQIQNPHIYLRQKFQIKHIILIYCNDKCFSYLVPTKNYIVQIVMLL